MNTNRLNALAAQLLSARTAADQMESNLCVANVVSGGRAITATAQAMLEQAQLVARCTERRLYAYRAGQSAARNGIAGRDCPFTHSELAGLFWDGAADAMAELCQ